MQFHQDGFFPGDPRFADPADRVAAATTDRPLPAQVDLCIVGCGPAGLNLAAQLAQFSDISTCIVEQKDARLLLGQADGIACRTMEMFQAYGFAEQIKQEAYWVNETAFWKPDSNRPTEIVRGSKIDDVEHDLSEMPHVIINQARVHDRFLEVMRRAPAKLEPHYSRRLADLRVDPEASDYPVTLTLQRQLDGKPDGQASETLRARYVVGCDGARSSVRRAIGRQLVGDSLNQAWGVMDLLGVTDFPDIRLKNVIYSSEGNMVIIPREGGYMVRLYIELDELSENQRVSRDTITPDYLVAAANRMFHPYRFEVREVAWWSVYEIGQRLATAFDDAEPGRPARVFLAGDACHTHSPKAGQGMNTSINDTWNLGWKLAQVLTGRADPVLLASYSVERLGVARQLLDFDRELSAMLSTKPRSADNPDGVDPAEFQKYFQQFGRFTAGTAICYPPSSLVGEGKSQALASGETLGMRFHSAPVIRHADARPMQLGHCIEADGRWRLFAFAGKQQPLSEACRVRALCDFLVQDPASPLAIFTPAKADRDAVFDLRAIFQVGNRELAINSIHPLLAPSKGKLGLRDYEKVFCPDLGGAGDIYDLRGINRERGCLILVRPDQYVAEILELDDYAGLGRFFDRVLLPA